MCEGGHEDDGGVGEEGLEDAAVPAGEDANQQSGQEDGGQCCCYHLPFLSRRQKVAAIIAKWRSQGKSFPKKREKAGDKDEQEPWSKRRWSLVTDQR